MPSRSGNQQFLTPWLIRKRTIMIGTDRLQNRARRESFQPTLLSILVNPAYIIRRGLFLAIKDLAHSISGNVLDFGCGSKPYEALFSHATEYVGVDLEGTGHNHSDSRVDVFYDGRSLPFSDGQFDAVVSFEVFEHVFNLPEMVKEIHRVTKDSGKLLISIPFAWGEHEIPYDYARYTSFGISDLLEKCGYETIDVRKTTTFFCAVIQMLISYLTHIAPRNRLFRHAFQLFLIFPSTLAALCLDSMLPKRYEYYGNCVVLARKRIISKE